MSPSLRKRMCCIKIFCKVTEKNKWIMNITMSITFVSHNKVSYFTQQEIRQLRKSNFVGNETVNSTTAEFCHC